MVIVSPFLSRMMATNYIGAFCLTKVLMPLLENSPVPSRVINVTSFTHRNGKLGVNVAVYVQVMTLLVKITSVILTLRVRKEVHLTWLSLNIQLMLVFLSKCEIQISSVSIVMIVLYFVHAY